MKLFIRCFSFVIFHVPSRFRNSFSQTTTKKNFKGLKVEGGLISLLCLSTFSSSSSFPERDGHEWTRLNFFETSLTLQDVYWFSQWDTLPSRHILRLLLAYRKTTHQNEATKNFFFHRKWTLSLPALRRLNKLSINPESWCAVSRTIIRASRIITFRSHTIHQSLLPRFLAAIHLPLLFLHNFCSFTWKAINKPWDCMSLSLNI